MVIDLSQVDVSMDGIELRDREFSTAMREGREPNVSVAQVLQIWNCNCHADWPSGVQA